MQTKPQRRLDQDQDSQREGLETCVPLSSKNGSSAIGNLNEIAELSRQDRFEVMQEGCTWMRVKLLGREHRTFPAGLPIKQVLGNHTLS